MSFKFNFTIDNDETKDEQLTSVDKKDSDNDNSGQVSGDREAVEIFPDLTKLPKMIKSSQTVHSFDNDVEITTVDRDEVEKSICQNARQKSDIVTAVNQHSDLVQGVYEGGLTIWECSRDLVEYLVSTAVNFNNKSVLELGCGAGLPGLYSMINGAKQVHFQDYNREVIEEFTIPNVHLNTPQTSCQCRFIAGDWLTVPKILFSQRYDYILSAETIYNPDNYKQLHSVFDQLLQPNTGVILISAKSYYFGVGGGTRLFEEFLNKSGEFTSSVVKVIEAGVPREIIQIERKTGLT